ncbi:MAG: hypothetical protein JXA73_22425 [Acidobacteria bacterium]|nr:hypothetical protein [Acidobacteriota bacterium]
MLDEQIVDIESRILELEFQDAKRKNSKILADVAKFRAKTASASQRKDFSIRMETKNGKTAYQLRSASGEVKALPADRALWPSDVRATVTRYETLMQKSREKSRYNAAMIRTGLEFR